MPLLPSALPPKGEARRYVANDFLNLIALLLRVGLFGWVAEPLFSLPLAEAVPYSNFLLTFLLRVVKSDIQ